MNCANLFYNYNTPIFARFFFLMKRKKMSKAKFTKTQLKELIEVYQGDVKKLNFQIQNARTIIAALKADLKTAPEDVKPVIKKAPAKKPVAKKAPAKKPVAKKAPAKKPVAKKAPAKKPVAKKVVKKAVAKKVVKKAAIKKTAAKKSGRKGNAGRKPIVTPWDNFVMTAINEAGKGMISGDLFAIVKTKAKAAKEYKNDATTKKLINRSLQKLVNKQKVLAKFKHAGRGFAYGLPTWGSRGRLKPAFKA